VIPLERKAESKNIEQSSNFKDSEDGDQPNKSTPGKRIQKIALWEIKKKQPTGGKKNRLTYSNEP